MLCCREEISVAYREKVYCEEFSVLFQLAKVPCSRRIQIPWPDLSRDLAQYCKPIIGSENVAYHVIVGLFCVCVCVCVCKRESVCASVSVTHARRIPFTRAKAHTHKHAPSHAYTSHAPNTNTSHTPNTNASHAPNTNTIHAL